VTVQDAPKRDIARGAGRGGVAVLGAKVYFILAGLVQQALLPRVIGLAGYGALSRVLAVANVVNNVVVSSSVQGVSRAVAGSRGDDRPVLRAALRIHLPLALGAMVLCAIGAPLVARAQLAKHVTLPLLAASLVVGLYGAYAPLVGALNGRGQFQRQAMLDATFATLRTVGLVGGGWLLARAGMGPLGAILGFAAAAAAIVPMALRWSGSGTAPADGRPALDARTYLLGLAPLGLAQLATNAVMQSDITLLGRFLSQAALGTGLVGDTARDAADEWVAVYRACQLFAFLPYQLLLSVTQVLFPMLARAKADADDEAVRSYVARGVRLAAIVGGGLVAVVAGMPGSLLRFAYGAEVSARGGDALRVLALGQGAFALMGVGATVLASLGHERRAARITAGALAVTVLVCWLLVPRATFGRDQLAMSALSVACAMACTLVVTGVVVRRVAGAFLPWATAVRVGLALAVVVLVGTRLPTVGRALAPFVALCMFLAYAVLLLVTREVKRDDIAAFVGMLRRRR
jgi:stage V sporulation protein B